MISINKIDQFILDWKSSFCAISVQDISENSDYTSIFNDQHLKRIQEIPLNSHKKRAMIILCADYKSLEFLYCIPTHIVLNCTSEMLRVFWGQFFQ